METNIPSKKPQWIEIRDHVGKLLFKYDIVNNVIEIRRGSMVYDYIKLDEIRAEHGILAAMPAPSTYEVVTVQPIDKSH